MLTIRRQAEIVSDPSLSARFGIDGLAITRLISGDTTGATALVVDRVEFEPDVRHALHRHPAAEQVIYVLDGSGLCLREGDDLPMGAGDAVYIPAGSWHGFFNNSAGRTVILNITGGVSMPEQGGYEEASITA